MSTGCVNRVYQQDVSSPSLVWSQCSGGLRCEGLGDWRLAHGQPVGGGGSGEWVEEGVGESGVRGWVDKVG